MSKPSGGKELTAEESAAVASLKRLAKRWPKSLSIVSADGALVVMRSADRIGDDDSLNQDAVVAEIRGIPNTGGAW